MNQLFVRFLKPDNPEKTHSKCVAVSSSSEPGERLEFDEKCRWKVSRPPRHPRCTHAAICSPIIWFGQYDPVKLTAKQLHLQHSNVQYLWWQDPDVAWMPHLGAMAYLRSNFAKPIQPDAWCCNCRSDYVRGFLTWTIPKTTGFNTKMV